MLDKASEAKIDWNAITRDAAQGFVYLGWAVMNQQDAQDLHAVLADRTKVDLDADIVDAHGTLWRLKKDVWKHFLQPSAGQEEINRVCKAIPVLFEAMNAKEGHPMDTMHVLYLDGQMETIPFGTRFPATQAFVDLFPAPGPR